jgi:peptide/nickel transport system substrate-binding protein
MTDTGDSVIARNIYDPLIALDNSFHPMPMLATSWEPNADATSWTFHLRKDVKFHDGRDFTSADVVYTYKRLIDEKINSPAKPELGVLDPDGIVAVDKYTVRFTTKQPVAELPIILSTRAAVIIPDGATGKELNKHPVGTGPFTVKEFTPNEPRRVFSRNEHYWQAGLPKAQCLEVTPITEPMTRMAALMSGQIDLDLVVDPTAVSTLKGNSDVQLKGSAGGGYALSLVMFIDTKPFDDERVREAMKLVVDRQAMVQSVLFGFGEFGNDNPIPPSREDAYRKDPIPQDIEKAKKLLAEAGYPNGLDVDFYTAKHFPGIDLMGQAYAQMAAQAGIRVNIINTPTDSYWDDVWLKKPFTSTYLGPRPTSSALSLTFQSSSAWNETHWKNADYDGLLRKASATVDPEARKKLYQQAQQMLAEHGGAITPVFAGVIAGMRKGCSGYEPHIDTNRLDLRNISCQ